ncbi:MULTISPECIES: rod-binding protein [unclassified Caulobacter]|jgi:Rod binding domain-containing protein|uniref:rod-binding protein n=1 Tax=unclassified Caulobacter TaxID=2648921 RepID=UPI00078262E1|nr:MULTISPECIES: rod-binding protein [unclassified Caulobacter]AZS20558.1 chemotaxis protein chel [Caulobacter sp. FWC26]MCA0358188.1 rod-binding protein [Pseudomonadota bacterium]
MSLLSALTSLPPRIDAAAATAKQLVVSAEEKVKRARIAETAKTFEASFLSVMTQQMFEGVKTSAPFGGGNGEEMFKSVLTDAISKEITKAGGVGLASTIQREMLKLQGLKE